MSIIIEHGQTLLDIVTVPAKALRAKVIGNPPSGDHVQSVVDGFHRAFEITNRQGKSIPPQGTASEFAVIAGVIYDAELIS